MNVQSKDLSIWHNRLRHSSHHVLHQILNKCHKSHISNKAASKFCYTCQYGEGHELSFHSSLIKTSKPLELIHSNVLGSSPLLFTEGYRYHVAFDEQTFIFFIGFSILLTSSSYQKIMSTTQAPSLLVVLLQLIPRPSIVKKGNLNIEENSPTSPSKNQFTSYIPNGNSSEPTQYPTTSASKN